MAMAADWSSLPSELLNLVGDALLSSGDIDCYVSLRAVCHSWRDATADPRGPDPRFLPRRWVMLEPGDVNVRDTRRLFLNVDTGRFVWKDLPALRDYTYVAADNDGLLILRGPSASKKIFALNPFTGASIRFPVYPTHAPDGGLVVVAAGSSLMVVLYSFHADQQFRLIPDVDVATSSDLNFGGASRWILQAKPVLDAFESVVSFQGRVYAVDMKGTIAVLEDRWRFTAVVVGGWRECWQPPFLVDNAGELLVVRGPTSTGDKVQVFRVDLENKALRMIKSIGNQAIFLGSRSLSVNVDNLPSIEANCIYNFRRLMEIDMHRIEDGSHEKVFEPIVDNEVPMIMLLLNQALPLCLPRLLMNHAYFGTS
jgi:hypothetical protein